MKNKFLNFFFTGSVNRPENKTFPKVNTLFDAIEITRGSKIVRESVNFLRFNNYGSIENRKISLRKRSKRGSDSNPYFRNVNLIIIGEILISSKNQVFNEFTSSFVDIFSTYGLIKAIAD